MQLNNIFFMYLSLQNKNSCFSIIHGIKCQLDIATYALNRLPAQYVRTDAGALYKKLNNQLPQAEATILTEVTKAIEIINSNPNHESA